MQTVDVKKIPGEAKPIAEFLKAHVRGRVKTAETQIKLEGATHKEVKLLLHKFLHHRGLEGYRVLSQSGVLQVAPPHRGAAHRPAEGTPPSAASTMPYFFPNTPVPMPEKKASKLKKATRRKKT